VVDPQESARLMEDFIEDTLGLWLELTTYAKHAKVETVQLSSPIRILDWIA
jgi:hypothetical protein